MRVSKALVIAFAAPSFAFTPFKAANATAANANATSIVPGAYIAQFNPGHESADAFIQNLTANGISIDPRHVFQPDVFSGISFHLTTDSKANLDLISNFTQVKVISPVRLFKRMAPSQPLWKSVDTRKLGKKIKRIVTTSNDTFSTHVMTGVDKLHKEGLDGSGIRIAEIDTGIDYTLPALGGCFGPGCKVAFGKDLVGDAYDGTNTPIPDDDPMDCLGHGTHVAGIIAASNDPYVLGVAPNATLGIYKVFGCVDSVANDVLIAAFTMAFNDGVDVITSSIGGIDGWPEEPWSLATSNIVAAGTPCMLAGGNEGYYGLYYGSSAASGKDVTSVGSVDNINTPSITSAGHYIVNDQSTLFAYTESIAALSTFNGVTLPLWVDTFDTTVSDDGCNGFSANLAGKIALIRRGTCEYAEKAQAVVDAGGEYVMFYNNVDDGSTPFVGGPPIVAAGMISPTLGETLVGLLAAGKVVTLTFSVDGDLIVDTPGPVNTVTGGRMSMYSTWNPSNENDIKPVVSGPGGNILSTYLTSQGGYAVESGTSMATPFIAGVVALYKQAKGKTVSPLTINAALSATAHPLNLNDGATTYPFLTSVAQQGGGLVDAYHMIHTGVAVTEANLAFNDTANHVKNAAFYVQNTGTTTLSYTLTHAPAANVYAFAPWDPNDETSDMLPSTFNVGQPLPMDTKYASVVISPNTLSLKPGEKKRVTVSASPDPSLNSTLVPFYSGYINVTGGGESISLAYGGAATVMHDIQVLAPGWPDLQTNYAYDFNGSMAIFKPSVFAIPVFWWNTRWSTAELRLDVVSVGGKNPVAALGLETVGSVDGFPQNWNPRGFLGLMNQINWYGAMNDGTFLPSGTYKLVMRLAKPYADLNRAREFERYDTPAFYMDMS